MGKPTATLTVITDVVHLIKTTTGDSSKMTVTTGCGQEFTLRRPKGALVEAGVTCWGSEVTCDGCRVGS
jgi:hypothetical protein